MIFFRKHQAVWTKFQQYLDVVGDTLTTFSRNFDYYLANGLTPEFEKRTEELHLKESQADDLQDVIELELYAKSLLPDSREDMCRILDVLDQLPDQAEDILRQLINQRIVLPELLADDLRELAAVGVDTYSLVRKAVLEAFSCPRNVRKLTAEIDGRESMGDKLQQRTVHKLFGSDLNLDEKLLFKDIIYEVGRLCDIQDHIGTHLNIFIVKRSV